MADRRERDRQTESRRILDRVSQEAESGGRTAIGRAASRAHDHLSASEVDREDWAEYWGTRIGRAAGIIIVAGLFFWLLHYLMLGE